PDTTGTSFDVEIGNTSWLEPRTITGVRLQIPGEHNVMNALAAIGVASNLGVSDTDIKQGFLRFQGVKRRFTTTGVVNDIRIIDDYGHHPVEITATLKAARQAVAGTSGHVLAVMQPHRYSRVRDLM